MEHTEGGGATSVPGAATDVCSCASHGLRDATDRSPLLDRRRVLDRPRIKNIAHHFDHATIPGLNVSAVVSWDTHKFVVPNRTHLFRSGRVDGLTGRMDHSDAMEDPHRETKYKPGHNPHWPVCHRFGPRFIIFCHPSYSSGQFIYLHTPWGFKL